ncbi:MAG: DUF167 domain-containing protein [Alphaproteobacteria bacterium]
MTISKKVFIYLTPNAAQDKFGGTLEKDNKVYLRVSVKAAPKEGEANAALIQFLAKAWGLPKSHIQLIQGAHSRYKTLLVQDNEGKIILPSIQSLLDL